MADRDDGGPDDQATEYTIWSNETMERLSVEERRRLHVWIVEMIRSDVDEALESGTLFARRDAGVIRTILQVDERGWRELSRIHLETLEAVLRVQAASAERLAETGEAGITALTAAICSVLPAVPVDPPSPL